MSNYTRSNQGAANIGALNPTIGWPQQPAVPQAPQYPAYPVQPAIPQYPVMPQYPMYPKRGSGLRGLLGLFGLGTDGTPVWQRPWFPYAMLGALGVGIYFIARSRGGNLPEDVLFRNPSTGAPPEDAPTMVQATYNLMTRSAEDNGESARSVEWSHTGNTWMIGDTKGRYGHIVTKPSGKIWVAYHRTSSGDKKLQPSEAADLARDFFAGGASYAEEAAY